MSRSSKLWLSTLLVSGVCLFARADYESQRWTFGQYPNRVGIIGINDEWTIITLGEEWQQPGLPPTGFGPYRFHMHPYTIIALVNTPIWSCVLALILHRWHRRRHVNAA